MYCSINYDDNLDALHEDGEEVDELNLKAGKIATGMDVPLKALRQPPLLPLSMAVHSHRPPTLCMKPRRNPYRTIESFSFIDKPQDERALTSFTASYTSIHAK